MENKHYLIIKYNSIAFCLLGTTLLGTLFLYSLSIGVMPLALLMLSVFGIFALSIWSIMLQPIEDIDFDEDLGAILIDEGILILSNITLLSLFALWYWG